MERKVLKGSAPTLVGYARLRSDDLVEGRPTGTPQVKVRTPAQPDPAWVDADVDTLLASVTTAAAAGDTTVAVESLFNDNYDPDAAVDAVAAHINGAYGIALVDAEAFAASWGLTTGASEATFRSLMEADAAFAAAFLVAMGQAITSTEYDDLVAAFLTVAQPAIAWVKGRRYIVADDGNTFVVESRANGSGALRLVDPLPEAIAEDATISGCAVLVAVDADATAIAGDASVEWSAVVEGEDVVFVDLFRIVARIPKATLTVSKLFELEPNVRGLGLPSDFAFRGTMKGAWEGRMQTVLENNGLFEEDVLSDDVLAPLHALACLLVLIQGDARYAGQYLEQQEERFRKLEATTFNRRSYAEQDQTSTPSPRDPSVREDRKRGIRVGR